MKLVRLIIALILFLAVGYVSLNTLVSHQVLAKNPLAALGLPTTTWQDIGHATTSQWQNRPTENQSVGGFLTTTWQALREEFSGLTSQSQTLNQQLQNLSGKQPLIGVAPPTGTPMPISTTTAASTASTAITPTPNPLLPTPTPEPFYTKALDYGKYVYCQEVIRDYEQQHPEIKKP